MMRKFLSILLSLLFSVNVFAQSDLQKVRIDSFEGGQNSADAYDAIALNQGVSVKNAILSKRKKLSKRKGQSLFVVDNGNTAFTGINRYDPSITEHYIVCASGASVIRARAGDSSWEVINTGYNQTPGFDTEFIQANDFLFCLNGTDRPDWYTGTAWTNNAGGATDPPVAKIGAWLRNYLFLSGHPDYLDYVYFSNNLTPAVFTGTNLFRVNTGDGQKVVWLEPFRLNELIIYKERSIYNLDITGVTPLDDWTLQPISRVIGCIAPRSVANLGNDQWFLSSAPIAVRSLSRTEQDKILLQMVSAPIQDIFDGTGVLTINTSQIQKACAVLYDNKYFLAIPTQTSTVNNIVLVYDFLTGGWSIFEGWYPAQWIVLNNNLYYMDALDGRVLRCYANVMDDFPKGPNVSNSASAVTAVVFSYETRAIDFDNPENYKQLDAIETEFDSTGDYNATVYLEKDNEGFQNIGTVALSGNVITLPVNLPFTLNPGGYAKNTFQVQNYGEFRKLAIKVEQAGAGEECGLKRITIFARTKPWRREN